MAIDAKQAAAIAAKYYEDISREPMKLSIEEVEFDDNGFWLITLGITTPYGLGALGAKPLSYKIFKIDTNSAEVKSMKIREIK